MAKTIPQLPALASLADDDALVMEDTSDAVTSRATVAQMVAYARSGMVPDTDARLSDARTPTAHKTSHAIGGADALTPSDIGAAAADHTHDGLTGGGGQGECRLEYASATEVKLQPVGRGSMLWPDGSNLTLPAAGLSLASSGLTAETVYYVYLTSAGALEASTTAPATTDGWRHKTGDPTRLLVGLVRPNASGQIQVDAAYIGVLSWFNRRRRHGTNTIKAQRSTTSQLTPVVLSAAAEQIGFLSWNEIVQVGLTGILLTSGAAAVYCGVGIDGALLGSLTPAQTSGANIWATAATPMAPALVSEGWHSAMAMGCVNAGVTYSMSLYGTTTNDNLCARIHVALEG
ncbi:hypothetical protein [Megalodesulfovibrio paquesii]